MSLNCSHDQKELEKALKRLYVHDEPESGYDTREEMQAARDRSRMLAYVTWFLILTAVVVVCFWLGVRTAGGGA